MAEHPTGETTRIKGSAPLREGQVFANYRIARQIATGGMGAVYRAEELATGRVVALKLVLTGDDSQGRRRFRAESRVLARLNHPRIARVYEVGVCGGLDFLAMEFVDGPTWDRWLAEGEQPLARIIEALAEVAEAAHYAHGQGIVHRDLKPGNIMLTRDGEVRLMDFGLARDLANSERLTLGSEAIGTPPYMAPEQAMNERERIGPATDVWSLGVILYESATGQLPFLGGSAYETFRAIACADPVKPSVRRPGLSRDLDTVVLRCLEKDPADRYASASVLADDLRRLARGQPVHPRSLRLSTLLRLLPLQWLMAVLSLLLIILVALGHGLLGAVLALAAGLGLAVWGWREWRNRRATERRLTELRAALEAMKDRIAGDQQRDWLPLYRAEFVPDRVDAEWECDGGLAEVRDHRLLRRGGAPMLSWLRRPVFGDFRAELRCVQTGRYLNDVTILFHAQVGEPHDSGYQLKLGAYDNTLSVLVRKGRRLWTSDGFALRRDQELQVELEMVGGRIRAWLDGREFLDHTDDQPLIGGRFGLHGWLAETQVIALTIYGLAASRRPDVLEVAEQQCSLAHYRSCLDILDGIEESAETPSRRHRIGEARQRAAARLGRDQEFAAARERVLAAWPQAAVWVNDDGLGVDLTPCAAEVEDLRPLAGLPVTSLCCRGSRVASLLPLQALPLRKVMLADLPLCSLEGLERSPIISMACDRCPLTDLGPLRGGPISFLTLFRSACKDLAPLAETTIAHLKLTSDHITDLSPLVGRPLQTLNLTLSRLADLQHLRGMSLHYLTIRAPVSDLDPLRGQPLRVFSLFGTQVQDLGPLAGAPVQELHLGTSPITALPESLGATLQVLDIRQTRITSLAPLGDCRLDRFLAVDNPVTDPGPLGRFPPDRPVFGRFPRPEPFWEAVVEEWRRRGEDAALRQWRVVEAVVAGQVAELRGLAVPFQDRRYLLVPLLMSYDEAGALAARTGACLACPSNANRLAFLLECSGMHPFWIGLEARGEGPCWANGDPRPAIRSDPHSGYGPDNNGIEQGHHAYRPDGHLLPVLEWRA